jgi:RNA polymerase sigma factor (sigma-70 family)
VTPAFAQRVHAERAFEKLYQRHVADVYRYALVVLRNEADAEDVTQTTFLNAFRALERGEHPRSPHNWLIRIAHNVCRQRFRQESRRPQQVHFDESVAEAPFQEGNETHTVEDIQRALGRLAFNQRSALVMRELEGRSYAEIAENLGVTVSAVETLIFRARRALREQLEESLTCEQAERAVSLQLDGELSRGDAGRLRAHLRECEDCASLARRQRAQRTALRGLAVIPLPSSLASLFGGGAATVGGAAAVKIGSAAIAAIVLGGAATQLPPRKHAHVPLPTLAPKAAVPAADSPAERVARKLRLPAAHHGGVTHHQRPGHPVHPTTSRHPSWAGHVRTSGAKHQGPTQHAHSPPKAGGLLAGLPATPRHDPPATHTHQTGKRSAFSHAPPRNVSPAAPRAKGNVNGSSQPQKRSPGLDGVGVRQAGTQAQGKGGSAGNGGGKPAS